MISHFLLNLRDVSTVESDSAHRSQLPTTHQDQGQVTTIRFASAINNMASSLGTSLRDGSHEHDEDEEDADIQIENIQTSKDMLKNDEEMQNNDVKEKDIAGPSGMLATTSEDCGSNLQDCA